MKSGIELVPSLLGSFPCAVEFDTPLSSSTGVCRLVSSGVWNLRGGSKSRIGLSFGMH